MCKMQRNLLLLLFSFIFNQAMAANHETIFICPADITIGCCNDYTNTVLTGHPMMANPSFISFTFQDEIFLNECREGYIVRTWTGYNGIGYYDCEQKITMEYQTGFDGHILWPPDWQGSCGDEMPFLSPQYDAGFCNQMAHTYHDDTLRIPGSVCLKILRNWKVIDWCKYNPNSNSDAGLWQHTQILKIIELGKPQFVECKSWEVGAENQNCTANFTFTKEAFDENCLMDSELRWRIEFDYNNDWSVDSIVDKKGPSVAFEVKNLGIGNHKIIWKVSDYCGNVSQCMELVEVKDSKPPTPFCYLSFPLILMPLENMLAVNAAMYMKDATDNCTEKDQLIHSWSPDPADSVRIFDCGDIGFQFLPIYSIDETGNSDFCLVFTRVQTHGSCAGNSFYLSGQLQTFSGEPVEGIAVGLGENSLNSFPCDTTDTEGDFSFPYVQTIADPAIYFKMGGNYSNGFTTLDLVILQNYLLGLYEPSNLEQFLLSADLNQDKKVNFIDLYLMRGVILGIVNPNQIIKPFRLFKEDPEHPGNYIQIESVSTSENNLKLKVIKTGDLKNYFSFPN